MLRFKGKVAGDRSEIEDIPLRDHDSPQITYVPETVSKLETLAPHVPRNLQMP
jgi:hypothetical protein